MADIKIWRKKDGSTVPFDKMSEAYVKNCIKMLEQNGKKDGTIHKSLNDELKEREKLTNAKVKRKFKLIAGD